tara:strand:- start:7166 stop:7609 length:444 start_codon:yes stop_codon:yes gene_type:complete
MEENQQHNFIKLTSEGYPIQLKHNKIDFYEIFLQFVNMSEENSFFAELLDEGVAMHAGMKTEICRMHHDNDHVYITSKINESETSSTGEFSVDEEYTILGHACLGVLYFCDLYALGTGQKTHFSSAKAKKQFDKATDNNDKFKAWPV